MENKRHLFITTTLLVLAIALIGGSMGAFGVYVLLHKTDTTKQQCLQYEQAGVIPTGSCTCVEKLYNGDWDKSYDWKDACYIVKGSK